MRDLRELLADSSRALSAEEAGTALGELAALKRAITARLGSSGHEPAATPAIAKSPDSPPGPVWSPDDLLTVDEAATMLKVSPRWLYRHAKKLPFTRRLSPKVLRFSRAALLKWLEKQRP
jgi:excisionase family DNA binding protein